MELRVKEQDASSITFEWTPPPDADYYVFYADGFHISDAPAIDKNGNKKTTAKFSKQYKQFEVVCIRYVHLDTDTGSYTFGSAFSNTSETVTQ
jgi:hypothetical protein